jgi:hypothetical protein
MIFQRGWQAQSAPGLSAVCTGTVAEHFVCRFGGELIVVVQVRGPEIRAKLRKGKLSPEPELQPFSGAAMQVRAGQPTRPVESNPRTAITG